MYTPSHLTRLEMQLRQDEAVARALQARLIRDAQPKRRPIRTRPIRRVGHRWRPA